ncbi:MAG: UvrD-helicase domain-containing protein, partial [Acidobacteria bacterium]|nr:UvrD-helicase domain-containing protein [Acidobacteriota bacterium]
MKSLVDHEERCQIRTLLDTTIVVEAAAGTGKTTELVCRIVEVLAQGRAQVGQIVAITFTEKAAGELKLRLRTELEKARANSAADSTRCRNIEDAIERLEEARINTIHGFCADLLRERPVEGRVDPAFEPLSETEARELYEEAFDSWLQRALQEPGEGLRRSLRRHSKDGPTERLKGAGWELLNWRDFSASWSRPQYDRTASVDKIAEQLREFHKLTSNPARPDRAFHRKTEIARMVSEKLGALETIGVRDYDLAEALLATLAEDRDFRTPGVAPGPQYSPGVSREAVESVHKTLLADVQDFVRTANSDLAALLQHELHASIDVYEELKARSSRLDFVDLLLRARNMLRDSQIVRADFQRRFTHILVDEFQDTDPVQAEIILLLAARDPAVQSWKQAVPTPGKLFIVGDPKQSIYRFRRADVGTYQEVKKLLLAGGAIELQLTTSFRSVPSIQSCVNSAFASIMVEDHQTLQAGYVPLSPHRAELASQPTVIALPVPEPYGKKELTAYAVDRSLPDAVGAFVGWLIRESGWTVTESGNPNERVPISGRHVCLLFRRFQDFGEDVTRPYVQALEARRILHMVVGGKSFHTREEVEALRTALTAIEYPDDQLSVYATLRGSFFALTDESLFAYRHQFRRLHPMRLPRETLTPEFEPVVKALALLAELHRGRNSRQVADTIAALMEATRAHAAFALRPSGEQVLANVLHVAEMARAWEQAGRLSFRAFVDQLRREAERGEAPEAPIMEDGSEGVRMMTVHKAKGLEFPIVILADLTAKLQLAQAGRYIETDRSLCAVRIGGWSPLELTSHEAEEIARDKAEGIRLAYVAATRARDLLVVPAVGDPWPRIQEFWIGPLGRAVYPLLEVRKHPRQATGCPKFAADTIKERPLGVGPTNGTVRPGLYTFTASQPYGVVWWDPDQLALGARPSYALRQEALLKEVDKSTLEQSLAAFRVWHAKKEAVVEAASVPSLRVQTITQHATHKSETTRPAEVKVIKIGSGTRGPGGARYGSLVHAILATVPLNADSATIEKVTALHGRILGANLDEIAHATSAVGVVLKHDILQRAAECDRLGRCRREAPVTLFENDVLLEGFVDLAFE